MLRNEIEQFRNRIDSIDNEILKLISRRRECAIKIGALKDELRTSSAEVKLGAYDSKREAEIIQKLAASFPNLSETSVEAIFREIISFCRNSAHKTVICILSNDWHYLEAAKAHFGRSCEFRGFTDSDEFMAALSESQFNIALVPQNVTAGALEKITNSGYIQNDIISVFLDEKMAKAYVFAHE